MELEDVSQLEEQVPLNNPPPNEDSTPSARESKSKSGNPPINEVVASIVALLMLHGRNLPGLLAKCTQAAKTLFQKCKQSELFRKIFATVATIGLAAFQKCKESELTRKIYQKVGESPTARKFQQNLGEWNKAAKIYYGANPQKAKQHMGVAAIAFLVVIKLLFFGNPIPPSRPIWSEADGGNILPNVLFVGFPHSGVEQVSEWMYTNTNVCAPKIQSNAVDTLESQTTAVAFFNRPKPMTAGLPWYAKRWQHCQSADLIMDATALYGHTAQSIHDFYGKLEDKHAVKNVKIIMALREPTDHIYWKYNSDKYWRKRITFESYISDIAAPCLYGKKPTAHMKDCPQYFARYSIHIKQWFKHFKRNQILILSFDELERDPAKAMSRVEAFLGYQKHKRGVSALSFPSSSKQAVSGKTVQADLLPGCAGQHVLQTIFEDWNIELYDLLRLNKGLPIEEHPFPEFELGACKEELQK